MTDRSTNKLWTKFRSTFFLLGLCCSLVIVFSAFQIVVPYSEPDEFEIIFDNLPDIEVTPPATRHRKKRVIPPKKVVEKIQLDLPPEIVTEEFVADESDPIDPYDEDDDFTNEDYIEEDINKGKIEVEKKKEDEEIHFFVSRMPVFGECRNIDDQIQRDKCSEKAIYNYIYKNLHYPEIAKINGIEGKVTAQIVIDKTGKVSDIQILMHPGGGLDKEVLKVLNKMPDWQAGMNNFEPVHVRYTIPVSFELN